MVQANVDEIFWPPFEVLYGRLETLKLEQTWDREGRDAFQKEKALFVPWLKKGLGGFLKPNDGSKKKIESSEKVIVPLFVTTAEGVLTKEDKEIAVEKKLRGAALEVSHFLQLDELQSLYLVDEWLSSLENKDKNTSSASRSQHLGSHYGVLLLDYSSNRHNGGLSEDGHLTAQQLSEITMLYVHERNLLLRSIEDILWNGEVLAESECLDDVDGIIQELLMASPDVESICVMVLKENLEMRGSPAQLAMIMSKGGSVQFMEWSEIFIQGLYQERVVLITILMLLYYHPRKQCSPDRFLELMLLFERTLFSVSSGDAKENKMAQNLAGLLLLEVMVLDVEMPLNKMAEDRNINEEVLPLLFGPIRERISKALISVSSGSSPCPVVGPLASVWASLLLIVPNKDKDVYQLLASRSDDLNALGELSTIVQLSEIHSAATEIASAITFNSITIILAAFGLDPTKIPHTATCKILKALETIFRGQSTVCDSFASCPEDPINRPLQHFIDNCALLFPANSVPLMRVLAATSGSLLGAKYASRYMFNMKYLTFELSDLDRTILLRDDRTDGILVSPSDPTVVGGVLSVPKGVRGSCFFAPQGIPPLLSIDTLEVRYIRWQYAWPEGTAYVVLLHRVTQALTILDHKQNRYTQALDEILYIMKFYERICSFDDVFVLEILRMEDSREPAATPGLMAILEHAAASLLILAQNGIGGQELEQTYESLYLCFRLFSYFGPYMPGTVLAGASKALGLSSLTLNANDTLFLCPSLPSMSIILYGWSGGSKMAHEALASILHLASVLLQTACGPHKQILRFLNILFRDTIPVLSKRVGSEEKWNLSALCLTLVRHALVLERERVGSTIFNTQEVVRMIHPLLPPNAANLENIAKERHRQAEAEAAERCCIKWMRLVPVLFAKLDMPNAGDLMKIEDDHKGGKEEFFVSPDGTSPSPAATLLSYLVYPYFGAEDKAAVVKCMSHLLSHDSKISIAALLPQAGPNSSLHKSCMIIENAVSSIQRSQKYGLFAASCDVLCSVVLHHPTLEVLLLPDISSQGIDRGGPISCNCTKHIIAHLKNARELYGLSPELLIKVLEVLCAAMTSQTMNGVMVSVMQDMGCWEALIDTLKDASQEDTTDEISTRAVHEVIVHRRKVGMKIMDILTAALCSGKLLTDVEKQERSKQPWNLVQMFLQNSFQAVAPRLMEIYSEECKQAMQKKIFEARLAALVTGINTLEFCVVNGGLLKLLRNPDSSFIRELWESCRSICPSSELDDLQAWPKSLIERIDSIMKNTYDLNELLTEPYKGIADVILNQVRTWNNDSSISLNALSLPNKIGGAWRNVLSDYRNLEEKTFDLLVWLELEAVSCECLRSLDALTAVAISQEAVAVDNVSGSFDISILNSILYHIFDSYEERSKEDILDLNSETPLLIARLVSWIEALSSTGVREEKCVEILAMLQSWIEWPPRNLIGSDGTSEVTANLLSSALNSMPSAENYNSDVVEACSNLLPGLLELCSKEMPKDVVCPAVALAINIMQLSITPSVWADHMNYVGIVEALDAALTVLHRVSFVTQDAEFSTQTSRLHSLLLLAAQIVSNSEFGARTLVFQGLCDQISAIAQWYKGAAANPENGIYSTEDGIYLLGCYTTNHCRFQPQKVWCTLLTLASTLWTVLPGDKRVENMMIYLSMIMSERLVYVLCPYEGEHKPLTLGYIEEAKAISYFFCILSKIQGVWLINRANGVARVREATASMLSFATVDPSQIACLPISNEEKEAANKPSLFNLSKGWFGLTLQTDGKEMLDSGENDSSDCNLFSEAIAVGMYTIMKNAVAFQVTMSPEISEKESRNLTKLWASPESLETIIRTSAQVLMQCNTSQYNKEAPRSLVQSLIGSIVGAREMLHIESRALPADMENEVNDICKRSRALFLEAD